MQGSLSEFRLAELLQLVAVQQKTGLLRLTRGKQLVTFYFDHGVLIATRDRRHSTFDPLLDYLTNVGWIQPEMGAFLRTRMETSKEDLADVLLGERFLTELELDQVLDDLAQELVHLTFGWREGTYNFIGGDEAIAGLRHKIGLKIDSALMEAARRADEWPRLLEKLPGPDTILDLERAPDTSFGERGYALLAQLVGPTRLGDLVRRARLSEFETYEVVSQAVEAGVVHIVERPSAPPARRVETSPHEPEPERPPVRRPATGPRRNLLSVQRPHGWGLALGVGVLCALAAWLLAPHLTSHRSLEALRTLEAAEARENVRLQIEVYRAVHGRYPAALDDLAKDALASPAVLARAAPLRYSLTPDGRGFVLTSVDPAADVAPVH